MTREELSGMTDDQLMETVRKDNLRKAYDVLVLRHYREALLLFCVDGMTYREIGEAMGKNAAQVRILLHRARKKLQSQRRDRE